ncbi:MAG: universal stress protein [Actinomycetota bacterium]
MSDASPKLLLLYDGSSVADRALQRTLERALQLQASVTVLGVVPPRLWRAKQGQFVIPPEKHDQEFAHEQVRRARMVFGQAGVHTEGRVRTGPPVAVINEEAARGYEAVVVATRPTPTGAPDLAMLVTVPDGCELIAVT